MLGREALQQVLGLGQAHVNHPLRPILTPCAVSARVGGGEVLGWLTKDEAPGICLQSYSASYMEQSVGFEVRTALESFLLSCRNYVILSQGFYLTLGHSVPG